MPSQRQYETVTPEYADNKAVNWNARDDNMATVDWDGLVSMNNQAGWIEDLVKVDTENLKLNSYALSIYFTLLKRIIPALFEFRK